MPNASAIPRSRRIVELDALRALAAINLMLFHFTHVYSVKYGFTSPLAFEFPWGKYGVQLFFMLSGLVNAMALLGKRDASSFLTSRAWRILPLFCVAMLVNLLLVNALPLSSRAWTWPETVANLTLMPNLFGVACLEPVLWTLQVEVLFYGWLVMAWWRGWLDRPFWPALAVLGGCLILCPLLDQAELLWPAGGVAAGLSFARQILLVDYWPLFVVGIALQAVGRQWSPRSAVVDGESGQISGAETGRTPAAWWRGFAHAGGPSARWHVAVMVLALTVFHWTDRHDHNPLVSLLLTGLLAGAVCGWLPLLRWKPLLWVSAISYPLYLFHDNCGSTAIWWMNRRLGWSPLFCLAAALVLAAAIAWIATYWVEKPLVATLRARLGKVKSDSAVPAHAEAWGATP
jgi:peptidoglycan/LPS O-acetylase OafA/YrhL